MKKLLAKRIPAPLANLQYSVRNVLLCRILQKPSETANGELNGHCFATN